MPPPENALPHEQLQWHIDQDERQEIECQAFLHSAGQLLITGLDAVIHVGRREQQMMVGRADYFIVYTAFDGNHRPRRSACVWEVKAPQCHLFTENTVEKLSPSEDLVDAETQLMYYYEELRGNRLLRERYDIASEDDVYFGGVIIGSEDRMVRKRARSNISDEQAAILANEAYRLRTRTFYRPNHMRLLTWSAVVQHLTPIAAGHPVNV